MSLLPRTTAGVLAGSNRISCSRVGTVTFLTCTPSLLQGQPDCAMHCFWKEPKTWTRAYTHLGGSLHPGHRGSPLTPHLDFPWKRARKPFTAETTEQAPPPAPCSGGNEVLRRTNFKSFVGGTGWSSTLHILGASKVGGRVDRRLGRLPPPPHLAPQWHLALTHSGASAWSEARAQVQFPVTVLGRQGEEPLSRGLYGQEGAAQS